MSNIAEAFAQAAVITYVIGGAGVILWQIKPLRNAVKSWWHRIHAPKVSPRPPPNQQHKGMNSHLRLLEKSHSQRFIYLIGCLLPFNNLSYWRSVLSSCANLFFNPVFSPACSCCFSLTPTACHALLLSTLPILWGHLARLWLRLVEENKDDSHRERWNDFYVWRELSKSFPKEEEKPSLKKFDFSRVPSPDHVFKNGLAGITSYMAINGFDDPNEAVQTIMSNADEYHRGATRARLLEEGCFCIESKQ